ncbi:EAL domain-containing protein [Parasphingorhabdus sp.]|uniref:EAL domain-containing protein n=1 Tax=Parasphingorhabdus sp. TaxID=2709688 RepID=UPI003D2C591F
MTIWSQITDRIEKFGSHSVAILFAFLATIALTMAGIVPAIEQTNRDLRSFVFERDASGQVAVVEIDSQSLKAMGSWPWSREAHADLITKLSENGAGQIAFDVDFSSAAEKASDVILADAISNAQAQVILATFLQQISNDGGGYSENLPPEIFQTHGLLGSVNVHPDALGQVSQYNYGTQITDQIRPTLAALLTRSSGQVGKSFLIDQSINLTSIPSFSAIDILNGDVDPIQIRGRNLIIGPTAAELGDRYATPKNGIIPRVYIHALAAETLSAGRDIPTIDGKALLLVTLALAILWWNIVTSSKDNQNRLVLPLLAMLLIVSSWGFFVYSLMEIEIASSIIFIVCLFLTDLVIETSRTTKRERTIDQLTGLPNATAMMDVAAKNMTAEIVVAEIANFAEIESILATEEQAEILQSMSKRLALLAADEQIYRTGRNQLSWFVADGYANRLEEYFDTAATFALSPTQIGSKKMRLKLSLGYHEGPTSNWFQLLSDAAMAAHKAAEMNYRWLKYSNDINQIIDEKLAILNEIDQAIENGQIWVAYQPKLDLSCGEVNAAEALVRWDHPQRGKIPPDRFIPILETEGDIANLTLHVLKITLTNVQQWSKSGLNISCSVNVSAALLGDPKFVSSAIAHVQQSRIDPNQIVFEITETAALGDLDKAKAVLEGMRKIGIKLSIDDYGTGQANLAYMQGFPADEIKIDQSFIKSMARSDVDRVMVSSTIEMAHKMNFKVVAEGVEDADCLALLRQFGCDTAQGWHIGRPVDAIIFEERWGTHAQTMTA